MRLREFRAYAWPWMMTLAAAGLWVMLPASALAQTGGDESMGGLPATSISPNGGEAPAPATTHHRSITRAPAAHHAPVTRASAAAVKAVPVEPGQGKLRLKEETWIYAQPSNKSAHIQKGEKGKFVMVTGSTHYFLRVKLKSGQDGYVLAAAVEMVAPADKLFMLTHNAPVLDAPNRWGKKVSEVHQGHAVHVVGIALNYMKIKMRSGLEGYIPSSALE